MGWHAVNMTEYPEIVLAKEKEICYMAVALVTDYDSGLVAEGMVKPVSTAEITRVFKDNINKIKTLLTQLITEIPTGKSCQCNRSLANARF